MLSRWRALLEERLREATAILSAVPGVHGIIVGGSLGRNEPWPLSDIDLLPIRSAEAADEVVRQQARLVDWWAASGRAQTLDVGWLAFTPEEARQAVEAGAIGAAALMRDRRWFHGLDKAYLGYGVHDPDGHAEAFAGWATTVRFDPRVIEARVREWKRQARDAQQRAN
jgi:predicted nucleotidyltransferase